jgi:hypothetical protein
MSILKRPGWANQEIFEEGRLHNDKLKERIGKMFDRLSLGYSPNHVIDKIASLIRHSNDGKIDLNKISDETIISIANSNEITKGKFTPALRPSFTSQYQNTNQEVNDTPTSEPEISFSVPTNIEKEPQLPVSVIPSEDAEEVKKCECSEKDQEFNPEIQKKELKKLKDPEDLEIPKKTNPPKNLSKESVRPSPTKVKELLQEDYVKRHQHKILVEKRYLGR